MLIMAVLSLDLLARIIVSIQLAGNQDVVWIQLTLVNTVTSLHVTYKARNF
jgi:hypothetical protein